MPQIKPDQIIYTKRKSISIQINNKAELIVRAPNRYPKNKINELLQDKKDWIEKGLSEAQSKKALIDRHKLSSEDIKQYKKDAKKRLKNKLDHWAQALNLEYNKMRLTSGRKTLGSCTSEKNINLSWRLLLLDEDLIDYIIVHELCHLIELSHSKRFWNSVKKVMPEYKVLKKRLKKDNWVLHT